MQPRPASSRAGGSASAHSPPFSPRAQQLRVWHSQSFSAKHSRQTAGGYLVRDGRQGEIERRGRQTRESPPGEERHPRGLSREGRPPAQANTAQANRSGSAPQRRRHRSSPPAACRRPQAASSFPEDVPPAQFQPPSSAPRDRYVPPAGALQERVSFFLVHALAPHLRAYRPAYAVHACIGAAQCRGACGRGTSAGAFWLMRPDSAHSRSITDKRPRARSCTETHTTPYPEIHSSDPCGHQCPYV